MMRWDPETKTVHMNLVSLEHCGFSHDEYRGELHLMGIDDEAAKWPDKIVVEFKAGAVMIVEASK